MATSVARFTLEPYEGGGLVGQLAAGTVEKVEGRRAVPTQAPGSAFFAAMAGLWGAFVTLIAVSPTTLDDCYDWLRGLPIVWELLMWLVMLPWTVAYLVYETPWEHWLRVLVVILVAVVHLGISVPRTAR
jgi:hypothetical protein